ncbi:MAG TPA: hypothetical protein VF762_21735, partial [Blastocatellia bacterium]
MNWINQLGGLLEQYTGVGASQAPSTVHDDFDQFAQVAPSGTLADGLSAAFRSDQTPPFGQMVGHLFGQSNGHQRAGILNTLISTLGPTLVAQLLARRGAQGLAGLLTGGRRQVTPEEAQQVPPEAVEEIAAQAEKKDPSVIDTLSNFYAEHPTLVKTLGGAALAI